MEGKVNIEIAASIFKDNFIGPDQISSIVNILPLSVPDIIPDIPFSEDFLMEYSKNNLLVLCVPQFQSGKSVNILELRNLFGLDPDKSEPCFYNQDWYLKEDFVSRNLDFSWVLIKKDVIESSRAVDPVKLQKEVNFPTAIVCAYTFFLYRLVYGVTLWPHDFIWCSDVDHNGDRIYVGRYLDIDGINKNGFSVHRHLSLRNCYAAISAYS
jgi:hypothetical protein